jgi:hypothetical protein
VTGRAAIADFWTKDAANITDVKINAGKVIQLGPDYVQRIGTFSGKVNGDKPAQSGGFSLGQ